MFFRNCQLRSGYKDLLNIKAASLMDNLGNTSLHDVAYRASSYNDVTSFAKSLNQGTLSVMSRTINNKGCLPYDLVKFNHKLSIADKQRTFEWLKGPMAQHEIAELSMRSNINDVLKRYSGLSKPLQANLEKACIANNQVREVVKTSFSHPQNNKLDKQANDDLYVTYVKLREGYKLYEHCSTNTYIKKITEQVVETKMGCCFEINTMALNNFINTHLQSYGVVKYIERGDHTISIVRDNQADTTSANDVVLDAWSNEVYPLFELLIRSTNLKTYGSMDQEYLRVITNFNPYFHFLNDQFHLAGKNANRKQLDIPAFDSGFYTFFSKASAESIVKSEVETTYSKRMG